MQCPRCLSLKLSPRSLRASGPERPQRVTGSGMFCLRMRGRPAPSDHHAATRVAIRRSKREAAMLELLDRQKTLTANQWKIIGTANLGDMLDFFDFFLIGYALAFIIGSWQLT